MYKILILSFCILLVGCEDKVVSLEDVISSDTELLKNNKYIITSVDATNESGNYNGGDELIIEVIYNSIIEVTGNPAIELKLNNSIDVNAYYVSGSGTNSLKFKYVVDSDDKSSSVELGSDRKISLNGGTIETVKNKAVSLNIPTQLNITKSIAISKSDDFKGPMSTQWTRNDSDNFDMDQNGQKDDDFELSFLFSSEKLVFNGRGADVWRNSREFLSLYLDNESGDFDYSIKINKRVNTNQWTKSGLMLANNHKDLTEGGVVFCGTTQGNGITMQWAKDGNGDINRSSHGQGQNTVPVWIRMKKNSNTVTCFYRYSTASSWTQHVAGTLVIPNGSSNYDVGIFSTSHNSGSSLTVSFDDFEVVP
jgi:hypothetical protein